MFQPQSETCRQQAHSKLVLKRQTSGPPHVKHRAYVQTRTTRCEKARYEHRVGPPKQTTSRGQIEAMDIVYPSCSKPARLQQTQLNIPTKRKKTITTTGELRKTKYNLDNAEQQMTELVGAKSSSTNAEMLHRLHSR